MKFYHDSISNCARRVDAFLGVYGIDVERVLVQLMRGEHRKPDYLSINPNGKVPTLVDGDLVLWESVAILRYLAFRDRKEALGTSRAEKARVDQWAIWGVAELGTECSVLVREDVLKPMRGLDADSGAIRESIKRIQKHLAVLAATLESSDFLVGAAPTIGEFVIVPDLESMLAQTSLRIEQSSIHGWMERVQSLSGWPAPFSTVG